MSPNYFRKFLILLKSFKCLSKVHPKVIQKALSSVYDQFIFSVFLNPFKRELPKFPHSHKIFQRSYIYRRSTNNLPFTQAFLQITHLYKILNIFQLQNTFLGHFTRNQRFEDILSIEMFSKDFHTKKYNQKIIRRSYSYRRPHKGFPAAEKFLKVFNLRKNFLGFRFSEDLLRRPAKKKNILKVFYIFKTFQNWLNCKRSSTY